MKRTATRLDAIRHRLLEGVLLRLVRRPDAGELVLRGGMLLRHWFHPLPRSALDLDLVAASPLTVEEAARRYLPLFTTGQEDDGVVFDADRLRIEGIWMHTDHPGVRIHARGAVGEDECNVQVDVTGGPPPRPAPVLGDFPTACGQVARMWMCRPEAIVGQKVQALWQLGVHGWRPKDLNDLRLLLERLPMDPALLQEAVAAAFTELAGTSDDARALFVASWWNRKASSARWLDFVESSRGQTAPDNLTAIVAEVAGRLAAVLKELP